MAINFFGSKKKTEIPTPEKTEAPAKKKFGGLKFAVSTEAIKKMAAKTLIAGGVAIPTATPRPANPPTAKPRSGGGLSNAFNAAAKGTTPLQAALRNNDRKILEALLGNGADITGRPAAAPPARPRMSPSFGF